MTSVSISGATDYLLRGLALKKSYPDEAKICFWMHDDMEEKSRESIKDMETQHKKAVKTLSVLENRMNEASSVIEVEEINIYLYKWFYSSVYNRDGSKTFHGLKMDDVYKERGLIVVRGYDMQDLDDEYRLLVLENKFRDSNGTFSIIKKQEYVNQIVNKSRMKKTGLPWVSLIKDISITPQFIHELKNVVCVYRNEQRIWGYLRGRKHGSILLNAGSHGMLEVSAHEIHVYPVVNENHIDELFLQGIYFPKVYWFSLDHCKIDKSDPKIQTFIKKLQAICVQPVTDVDEGKVENTKSKVTIVTNFKQESDVRKKVLCNRGILGQPKRQKLKDEMD
jgi:hypothetical protein